MKKRVLNFIYSKGGIGNIIYLSLFYSTLLIKMSKHEALYCKQNDAVAPLAWVPWVPRNPSIFEQWVPEPINFEPWKP